jgi:hypothetical protein
MYDPEAMDTKHPDLRAAHDRNDETLERIYIGRRFRNDTQRLEKLFEMYTEMTAGNADVPVGSGRKRNKNTKGPTRTAALPETSALPGLSQGEAERDER